MYEGEVRELANDFPKNATGRKYSATTLTPLMKLGGRLIPTTGEVRHSAAHVQEQRLRTGGDLRSNIEEEKHLSPAIGGQMQEIRRIGARPAFRGDTPNGVRERGFPHAPISRRELWGNSGRTSRHAECLSVLKLHSGATPKFSPRHQPSRRSAFRVVPSQNIKDRYPTCAR